MKGESEKKTNLQITEEDVLAVENLDLEIQDQEFIVRVDSFGCRKSTILRMVARARRNILWQTVHRWSADERGSPKGQGYPSHCRTDSKLSLHPLERALTGRTSNADAPHQGERPRAYCHKHRDITAQPEGQTLAENQYRKKKSKALPHLLFAPSCSATSAGSR